ncbi:MAG: helix-turn-helix transcriptional regulator, partial [Pseudomonadota bacterium]|nr:helix-turn-helix transcriptional regulator [Pseudomonadota bacterium]
MWTPGQKSDAQVTASNDGAEPMTVGRYLKSQREERGEDVTQVANMLRIHRSYLQAIEDSDIEKLPGPTYAIGFVRAYAEHLGLDGAQVTERFKEEGKVQASRTPLVLPSPLPEGRIPSGAILL